MEISVRHRATASASALMVSAEEHARRFNAKEIGLEHLLLAIVTDPECDAHRVLKTRSDMDDLGAFLMENIPRGELSSSLYTLTQESLPQSKRVQTVLGVLGQYGMHTGEPITTTEILCCMLGSSYDRDPGVEYTALWRDRWSSREVVGVLERIRRLERRGYWEALRNAAPPQVAAEHAGD